MTLTGCVSRSSVTAYSSRSTTATSTFTLSVRPGCFRRSYLYPSVEQRVLQRKQRSRVGALHSRELAVMCSDGKTLVSFGKHLLRNQAISIPTSELQTILLTSPADVDGTLIRTVGDNANKLHKLAFINAWKEVYGLETHLDVIQHHGNTDPLILIRVAEYHGIAKADVSVAVLRYDCCSHAFLTAVLSYISRLQPSSRTWRTQCSGITWQTQTKLA